MFVFPFANAYLMLLFLYILPGILLGLSLFRERKSIFDKMILGIPLAIFMQSFLTYFAVGIAGLDFSKNLVIASFGILWLFAIFAFFNAFKKELSIEWLKSHAKHLHFSLNSMLCVLAVLLAIFAFYLRMQSFSPTFYELDPYYYLYSPYQLIHEGSVPLFDQTAWYPNDSTHRVVPIWTHWISSMYSMLFDNLDIYYLSGTANLYPPLAFAFMLLFFFILFKELYGSIPAFLGSMAVFMNEIFFTKTLSGVFEAQPMGFMLLTYCIALFILTLKENKKIFYIGSGIALAFLFSASNFGNIGLGLIAVAIAANSLFLFYNKEKDSLKEFGMNSLCMFAVFIILMIFFLAYGGNLISLSAFKSIATWIAMGVFPYTLYFVYNYMEQKSQLANLNKIIAAIIALGILFLISPFNGPIVDPISSALSITQFNTPLERTIAEQQEIGSSISQFVGKYGVKDELFFHNILSMIYNLIFTFIYSLLNIVGMHISFNAKEPSLALSIFVVALFATAIKAAMQILSKKQAVHLILLVLLFGFLLGGGLKSKYGILLSYAFLVSVFVFFGVIFDSIKYATQKAKLAENLSSNIYTVAFIVLLLYFILDFSNSFLFSIFSVSGIESFSQNPDNYPTLFPTLCTQGVTRFCNENFEEFKVETYLQYDPEVCIYSIAQNIANKYGYIPDKMSAGIRFRCTNLPHKWVESMNFFKTLDEKSRVTSWWDYGHWLNYFGQTDAVVRNEHSYLNMILDVADGFVMKDEKGMANIMKKYGSNYLLIDDEILLQGDASGLFGKKFFALNYLACAGNNLTNVFTSQLNSQCEYNNLWETVFVGSEQCTISEQAGITGVKAYRILTVVSPGSQPVQKLEEAYCAGYTTLSTGEKTSVLYDLNNKNQANDLKMNKAFMYKVGETNSYVLIYTKDRVWLENGKITDGWEDRKGRFYDSTLYKGFIIGELEGFTKVFDNGNIKIYRMNS